MLNQAWVNSRQFGRRSKLKNTFFWLWSVVQLWFYWFFTRFFFFYSFLIVFSAYKTYATISPSKYLIKPSPFPHILSFFFSLFHLYSFFFLAFLEANLGVKKGQGRGENTPTDLGHKEVNPWGKSKFASFYPKNFLPWVKRLFLGI